MLFDYIEMQNFLISTIFTVTLLDWFGRFPLGKPKGEGRYSFLSNAVIKMCGSLPQFLLHVFIS